MKTTETLRTEIRAAETRVLTAPLETRATEQAYLDALCAELGQLEDELVDGFSGALAL